MVSPVKYTHEIINLAGKLDFHTQHGNVEVMKETIKELRAKINQVQTFMNQHEVVS